MDDNRTTSFSLDSRRTATTGRDDFERSWRTHVGDAFPLPTFSAATVADFRVRFRAARLHDTAITTVDGASAARTADGPVRDTDHVRLWLVRSGAWALGSRRNSVEHTVAAGGFLLRHAARTPHFALPPHTRAQCVVLPAAPFVLPLAGRGVTGRADAAEVRLLVAHASMVEKVLPDLSPAGVRAARDTLVELATAVANRGFDDVDTRLAPALAQAAKNLAEKRLAEADLSPAVLARELNVSVRTLQRAFAAGGESMTTYIRERRLESARKALSASRLTVSEVAARWQFADSSHFSRAFKRRYGLSPTEYTRRDP